MKISAARKAGGVWPMYSLRLHWSREEKAEKTGLSPWNWRDLIGSWSDVDSRCCGYASAVQPSQASFVLVHLHRHPPDAKLPDACRDRRDTIKREYLIALLMLSEVIFTRELGDSRG